MRYLSFLSLFVLTLTACSQAHGGGADSGPTPDAATFAPDAEVIVCSPPRPGCTAQIVAGRCVVTCPDSGVECGPPLGPGCCYASDCAVQCVRCPPPPMGCSYEPVDPGVCGCGEITCEGPTCDEDDRPEYGRECESRRDCTAVVIDWDCCGGGRVIGVSRNAEALREHERMCAPDFVCDCLPMFEPDGGSSVGRLEDVETFCTRGGECMTFDNRTEPG